MLPARDVMIIVLKMVQGETIRSGGGNLKVEDDREL